MLQPHRPQAARASGCCTLERPSSWQGAGALGRVPGEPGVRAWGRHQGPREFGARPGRPGERTPLGRPAPRAGAVLTARSQGSRLALGDPDPSALGMAADACLSSSHSEIRGQGAQPSQGVPSAQRPSQSVTTSPGRGPLPVPPRLPLLRPTASPHGGHRGAALGPMAPQMAYARGFRLRGAGGSPQRQRTGQPGPMRAQQQGSGPLLLNLSPRPWPTSYIKGLSVTAG